MSLPWSFIHAKTHYLGYLNDFTIESLNLHLGLKAIAQVTSRQGIQLHTMASTSSLTSLWQYRNALSSTQIMPVHFPHHSRHALDFGHNSLSWIQTSHSLSSGSAMHMTGIEGELGWRRSMRVVCWTSPLSFSLSHAHTHIFCLFLTQPFPKTQESWRSSWHTAQAMPPPP